MKVKKHKDGTIELEGTPDEIAEFEKKQWLNGKDFEVKESTKFSNGNQKKKILLLD